MLKPLVASACAISLLASCNDRREAKLVGWWKWKSCDDAGDVLFQKEHVFVSRQWAIMGFHEPPSLVENGTWRVSHDRLIMDYKTTTRSDKEKHVECPFVMFDNDTLVTRGADGFADTFKRAR
jgi:hypothetical protein